MPAAIKIPFGTKFGELTVLDEYKTILPGLHYWTVCTCGKIVSKAASQLHRGRVKSCGNCGWQEKFPAEYTTWRNMNERCSNPAHAAWEYYGARGIKVCSEWATSFAQFLQDMGPRPDNKSIDRYPNNDGNYEPGNCRWATASEQINNRRSWK